MPVAEIVARGHPRRTGEARPAHALRRRIQAPAGGARRQDHARAISAATAAIRSPTASATADGMTGRRPLRAVSPPAASISAMPAPRSLNWLFARKKGGALPAALRRHRPRALDARIRARHRGGSALARHRPATDGRASRERFAAYDEAARAAEGGGPALSLLRDAGGARRRRKRQLARGLPPVYDRAALKLTRRRARASSRPRAASRIGASCSMSRKVDWNDLVRGRSSISTRPAMSRSGAGARGRQLSLHAALGRRRYRPRHHPRDPRRGPCHQHRGADPDLRGAAAAEPPHFAHHSLLTGADGKGLSKRLGSLSIAGVARAGARGDGGGEPRGAARHLEIDPSGAPTTTN